MLHLLMALLGCAGDAGLAGDVPGNGIEDAGGGTPAEDDPAAKEAEAFFAEGTIYDFALSIPADSRAALAADPRTPVPATFGDGTDSFPVFVRLKGTSTFRPLSGKAAFKIDFHDTDPDARFHGLKRLTLNSMLQDTSMLHEHVAYWLYRHRGVAAPRHTYARVTVDGELYGLYGVVETEDEQLLKRAFADDHDGNLYEGNLSDFTPHDEHTFELEENGGVFEAPADMGTLVDTLAATSDADFLGTLDATFSLDALMNEWAIDLVSGNVDGYARLRNNFMAYHGEEGWYLMPWGHDQSFEWDRSITNYGEIQGFLLRRCGGIPDCEAQLRATEEDLMDDWDQGDLARVASDSANLIQADCRADPRAEFPCDVAHVLTFVLNRPASVRAELAR